MARHTAKSHKIRKVEILVIQTKIFINEYHNFEESFFLMEYELVGTIVAQVLVIFLIVAFGKSTWSNIIINEYFFALSVIGLIYSFGISLIVKLKTKNKKTKRNMSSICFLE